MKVKKGFKFVVLLIICIYVTALSFGDAISVTEIQDSIKNYKKKVRSTPLKISLKFQKTLFYPDYIILEILPKNKAKVQIRDSKEEKAGKKIKTKIMDYSPQYQLPYIEYTENVLLYTFHDRYYYERWDPQTEVSHYIEAYDGKDTMLINTYKIAETGGVKKEGKIYPGTRESLVLKYNPLKAWEAKYWATKPYTASHTEDGKIKIEYKNKEGNVKYIFLVSPKHYMFLSILVEKPNFKWEVRVNNTIDIKDLSFPTDIEELKYDYVSKKPEIFYHYKDIKYEILDISEFNAKCKLEFPEGTIHKEGKLSELPE